MATARPHNTHSAHAVLEFHRRLPQAILRPLTGRETGDGVDLALCYVRIMAAAQRHPIPPQGFSANLNWSEIWPERRNHAPTLYYTLVGVGALDKPIAFFSSEDPTLSALSKAHTDARGILDAAFGHHSGNHTHDAAANDTWRTLAIAAADGQRVEIRCQWDETERNALPWGVQIA